MKKWLIISLIVGHILYLQSLTFYVYPELFIYPYLVDQGFVPYRDILDQHFPTLLMLPIHLWNLGMQGEWQAKLVFFGLIILIHVLLYLISKKLFKKDSYIILPNIFYVAFQPLFDGATLWIDTFITPFALASVLCILHAVEEKPKKRKSHSALYYWVAAGVILGVVFTMKQTAAAFVAGTITFLLLRKKTRFGGIITLITSAVPVVCLIVWIQSRGLWSDFSYWTLTFNTQVYAKMAVTYPTTGQAIRVFLIWGCAYLLFFWSKKKSREMILFALSAFLLSFFAFGRFGMAYLQVALPFISLLLVSCIFSNSITVPSKLHTRLPKIHAGFVLFPLLLILTFWHVIYYARHSQGGSYLQSEATHHIVQKIKEQTETEDSIFIFGGNPVLYPLTGTIPPGDVYTVLVPWNYTVGQTKILDGLKKDPPKLIVIEEESEIDGQKGKDFGKEVYDYIQEYYEKEEEIEGHGFYKRI